MTEPERPDVSAMPDLTGMSQRDLWKSKDLDEQVAVVLAQVEKPRANLGGGGPPGRAD